MAYIPESIPACHPTDYVMAFLVEAQDPAAMVTSEFAKKKAAAEHDYRAAVSAAEQNYKARCEELAKGYVLERGRRGGLFIHFATGQTVELGTAELSEALQVVLTNHGK